ncbi:MAG: OmpH family outer membrane protein [Pseudomonadota bacterium]|nr:OmpH family outer membrane protein [Pseudomonadota bacterium]
MRLAILFVLASIAWQVQAQKKGGDKRDSYALIDMQRVILSVAEGKVARKKLEKEIKSKEKELLAAKEELEKLNKDWQSQAALLSDQAKLGKQKIFQEKLISMRNAEMEFHADIKRKEQNATKHIADKVAVLVEKIAAQEGFTMVFESSTSGLLYLKDPVDITARVITAYDKQHKVKKPTKAKQK